MECIVCYTIIFSLTLNHISAVDVSPFKVEEEREVNFIIGGIKPKAGLDRKYDRDILSQLRFRIISDKEDIKFIVVEEKTGLLKINHKIDREEICPMKERCFLEYDIIVSPANFFDVLKVSVEIIDKNDHSPKFPQQETDLRIPESTLPGTSFSVLSARDLDGGDNGRQNYQLVSDSHMFEMTAKAIAEGRMDVRIMLIDHLDREVKDNYKLKLIATDAGETPRSGTLDINVIITDANDNYPKFENENYEVTITENKEIGTSVISVHADDIDMGINGEIEYSFTDQTIQEYGHLFRIDSFSGDIFVKGEIDFEHGSLYILDVEASDKGHGSLKSPASVVIRVTDINDGAPDVAIHTLSETGVAEVAENSPKGTFVAHLSIHDGDTGSGGMFTCNINSQVFELVKNNAVEYKILTKVVFDREVKHRYQFPIVCVDEGFPAQSSDTDIVVRIVDVNDNDPKFQSNTYSINIHENRPAGSEIVTVNAKDLDSGRNSRIEYKLDLNARQYLRIDDKTGLITTAALLDYEKIQFLRFTVTAEDKGEKPRTSTATVYLNIKDEDDEMPIFDKDKYVFHINENQPIRSQVGMVKASDVDSKPFGQFTYSFDKDRSLMDMFRMDQQRGLITTNVELDRELRPVYHLVAMARPVSNPSQSCTASIVIHVEDENDNSPVFDFPRIGHNDTIAVSSDAHVGDKVASLRAHDQDIEENAELMFKITDGDQDDYFTMDSSSGNLYLYRSVSGLIGKTFTLTVGVTDTGHPRQSDESTLYITVSNSEYIAKPKIMSFNFLASDTLTVILSCTAGALLVLILIAVVAVVCVRERRRERAPHIVVHDTKETEKMLPPPQPEVDGNKIVGYNGTVANNGVSAVIDMREAKVVSNGSSPCKNTVEFIPDHNLQQNGSPKHNGYVKDYLTFGKPPNGNHYHQPPQRQYSPKPSPVNEIHRDYANVKRYPICNSTRTSTVSGEYVHYDPVDSDIL